MVEADDRGELADEQVEAGGEVAFLHPRFAGPADARVGERERRAFGPDEETFAAVAGDEVGAREIARELEPGHHGREGFQRELPRRRFDEHAGGARAFGREGLTELQGEQVASLAEDARLGGGDDRGLAGRAFDGSLGADADAFELVHGHILPVRLGSELDDAHVDVGEGGPGAVGAGTQGKVASRNLACGAADAEGAERDGAVGGADGQLGVDATHERLAGLFEGDAFQAMRAHAAYDRLSVLEGHRGFAGPAPGRRRDARRR